MVRFHEAGKKNGGPEPGDRWDPLVQRILTAAGPELERLRHRVSLLAQFDLWTRPLLPLAALLILVFGSALAWPRGEIASGEDDYPLLAEVLVPESVGLWLETGEAYTLAEFVDSLEEVEE